MKGRGENFSQLLFILHLLSAFIPQPSTLILFPMIPLEDTLEDILGKAKRGRRLDDRALENALARFQSTKADPAALARAAEPFRLHAPALRAIADGSWKPTPPVTPGTFAAFNTPFGEDMSVNSYLVWDGPGGTAVLFDTGTDAAPILATLGDHRLKLEAIFLTHTHQDHLEVLPELLARAPGAETFVPEREREAVGRALPVTEGQRFTLGGLNISARLTRGHTVGGLSYVVEIVGFPGTLAVVGDALFAGSQGGVPAELYAEALRLNAENILGLPADTIICPGHGPLTTVAQEKAHNPFYAS